MSYVCNAALSLLPPSAAYDVLLCPSEKSPPMLRPFALSLWIWSPSGIALTSPRASPPALSAATTEATGAGIGAARHPHLAFLVDMQLPLARQDKLVSGHPAQEVTARTKQADTARVQSSRVRPHSLRTLLEQPRRSCLWESSRKSCSFRSCS